MNLWLYSSEDSPEVDSDLMSEFAGYKPTFTFIPSQSYGADEDYDDFIDRFSQHAYINFKIFHLEREIPHRDVKSLLNSDLIYLSGGNTFHFLFHLRKTNIIHDLKYYALTGGFLAGHSAGAILQTPDIRMAAHPEFDRDDNECGIRKLTALGLVEFEFFPHYRNSRKYSLALTSLSKERDTLIYAVPDGSGIVRTSRGLRFYGRIWGFYRGHKFRIY